VTLLLTYADKNIAIQLSDRRFTYPDRQPFDMANKATVVRDRCIVTFTGYANAGSTRNDLPMDQWIARTLPSHRPTNMSEAYTALQIEAHRHLTVTKERRTVTALSGACWNR
jgi:hypothetical protein